MHKVMALNVARIVKINIFLSISALFSNTNI